MKKPARLSNKGRRNYGFREPVRPTSLEWADGITRIQHSVNLDEDAYNYAVNIARLTDQSLSYTLSVILEKAIHSEVERILKDLK